MKHRLSNKDKSRLIVQPRKKYEKLIRKLEEQMQADLLEQGWQRFKRKRDGVKRGLNKLEIPAGLVRSYRARVKEFVITLYLSGREISKIRKTAYKKWLKKNHRNVYKRFFSELETAEEAIQREFAKEGVVYSAFVKEKLKEWTEDFSEKRFQRTLTRAESVINRGLKEGWTRPDFRKVMKSEFARYTTYEVDRVITTEQTRSLNLGIYQHTQQDDLVVGYKWQVNYKGCPICANEESKGLIKKGELDRIPPAHPNCYDNETEIYTDNGWKLFKDAEKGEKALTLNPVSQQLEWAKITNTVSYKADKVLHLTNKRGSFDMRVSKNHPFFGYKRIDRGKKGRQLEPVFYSNIDQLSKSEFRFAISSEWQGKSPKHIDINGIEFETKQFCKLMGYYLSEGSTVLRKSGRHQIAIAQSKHLNKMWRGLKYLPVKRIWRGYKAIYISDERLGRYLIQFGKSNKKFVPDTIKRLSKEYIEGFLKAFRLGDGNVKKGKNWKGMLFGDSTSYFTSSKRLADDLGELVIKSGKSVSYRLIPSKGKKLKFKNGDYEINNNVWVISELLPKHRLFSNIDVVEQNYDDMVYDVEVDKNHTLLTRRNGRVVWGSNCECSLRTVYYTEPIAGASLN